IPNYEQEARIYGKYILDHLPASKVAVLYQADDYGRSYLDGLKSGLGTKAGDMIVATQSFQVADPTVDSQILNLAASKADVLLIAATSKQTIQALKKASEVKWRPQLFIAYPAASPERTYALAGKETAKDAISVTVFKDPEDPDTIGDTDIKEYFSFMKKYYPDGNKNETLNVVAYVEAGIMTEMLKQAGPNLTSDSFLKAMSHFTAEHIPGLRKGVMVRTSPDNYNLYPRPLMMRFDGARNVIMKEQK
ncbi:MAG: ABC transporter substrate-binding protein, partial [Proteobacteria bacterium]|nr:ABC transporter substrate-binding protein [Pseudomonadota bacterium]